MDRDENKLREAAYATCLALFKDIDPKPPKGISRPVFLDLVMQAMMAREALTPMTDTERGIAIRAIINTFIDEAPASPLEGMLVAQMLAHHEGLTHCQTRSLDSSQPEIQREKDRAYGIKAMGVYLKQMEVRSRMLARRAEFAPEARPDIVEAIQAGTRRLLEHGQMVPQSALDLL